LATLVRGFVVVGAILPTRNFLFTFAIVRENFMKKDASY
jgi:hypothetical protein